MTAVKINYTISSSAGYAVSSGLVQNITGSTVTLESLGIVEKVCEIGNRLYYIQSVNGNDVVLDREVANNIGDPYIVHPNSGKFPVQYNHRNSFILPDDFSSIDDYYTNAYICIHYYNDVVEWKRISSYNGTTKVAEVYGQLDGLPVEGIMFIIYGESGTVTDSTSDTITTDSNQSQYVISGLSLYIYYGTGTGQIRKITSVDSDVLTMDSSWNTIPDTSSKYTIFSGSSTGMIQLSKYNVISIVSSLVGAGVLYGLRFYKDTIYGLSYENIRQVDKSGSETFTCNSPCVDIFAIGFKGPFKTDMLVTLNCNELRDTAISEPIRDHDKGSLTRSVILGKGTDGRYHNVNADSAGNITISIEDPKDMFGYVSIAEPKLFEEIAFPYVSSYAKLNTFFSGSSGVYPNSPFCTIYTGTTAGSTARIRSLRRVYPTEGLVFKLIFNAIFTDPAEGCRQLIGYGDACNGVFYGYNGLSFGILHRRGGSLEIQQLTITGPATSTGTVTVTINDEVKTFEVTDGDTVYTIARQIAGSNFQDINFTSLEDNDKILFISEIADNLHTGTWSISGAGVTGTFVQVQAGSLPTDTWYPKEEWSVDHIDNTYVMPSINFTCGNLYHIDCNLIGFGTIKFHILNPETGKLQLVHRITYSNSSPIPIFSVAEQPMAFEVSNGQTTNNVGVSTSSITAFITGVQNKYTGTRLGSSNMRIEDLTSGTMYNIITIRNDGMFMGTVNITEVLGLTIGTSYKADKSARFIALVNATLDNTNGLTWEPRLYGGSVISTCKDFVEVVGGNEQISVNMGTNHNFFQIFDSLDVFMPPRYAFTMVILPVASVTAAEFAGSFFWIEK